MSLCSCGTIKTVDYLQKTKKKEEEKARAIFNYGRAVGFSEIIAMCEDSKVVYFQNQDGKTITMRCYIQEEI
jgi:hypothetical protein